MKKIVAVFHDNDLLSGDTMSYLTVIRYLNKKNYKIIAIVPKKDGNLEQYLMKLGIEVYSFCYGGNVYAESKSTIKKVRNYFECSIKSTISYLSVLKCYKILKDKNIDIVYSNTSTVYFGAWLAQKLQVNHIWHFREFGLLDQNSIHIWRRSFVKLANECKVITISKVLDHYCKENYGIKHTQMLYDDLELQECKCEKKAHNTFNVLITGRISEQKGQIYAIKAIEKLKNKNIKLYIAGKNNAYCEELKKYVYEKKVDNVVFCGLVEDMAKLRAEMDVSIVSSYSEAFGRTIIEDMLSDIVVVACNRGSVQELVKDKITGLVYKYGNIDDICNCIIELYSNIELKNQLLRNAREYAVEFTKYNTSKKIEEIIDGDFS